MNIIEKAAEIAKKYSTPCHGVGDCEFEAYRAALEMAEWIASNKVLDFTPQTQL